MTEMPLTTYVYKTLASERDPIFVIDVGCSYTGVGSEWNAFGPALRGVGFDPLEPEIARLQAIEARPNISYEAAFVGLKASQSVERPESKCQVLQELRYERSSAFRAAQLAAFDHVKEVFNAGANPKYSERHLAIDDWIAETKTPPQILKIDTEGADMQVLLGARQAIENSVLAIHMECMFQGSLGPYANTLACIDLFLREKGFCLFTMDPFRYTRSALPGPFIYDMFAQTKNGQLIWADALYLRDLAEEDYEATFGFSATSERVLATACIMELFGLQDCAAELIQRFADRLPYGAESLLDLLVPPYLGPGLSYRDYIARFERNPRLLFASAQSATPGEPILTHAPAPLDLGQRTVDPSWSSTIEPAADGICVRTAAKAWAYALVLRVPEAGGRGMLELDLEVTDGRIGLAVMGPALHDLSAQVWLAKSDEMRTVLLPVADLSQVEGVVVRNGTGDGSSSAAIIRARRLLRL
jgi:FkbM family methyltransferase